MVLLPSNSHQFKPPQVSAANWIPPQKMKYGVMEGGSHQAKLKSGLSLAWPITNFEQKISIKQIKNVTRAPTVRYDRTLGNKLQPQNACECKHKPNQDSRRADHQSLFSVNTENTSQKHKSTRDAKQNNNTNIVKCISTSRSIGIILWSAWPNWLTGARDTK